MHKAFPGTRAIVQLITLAAIAVIVTHFQLYGADDNKEILAQYTVTITSSQDHTPQESLLYVPPEAAPNTGLKTPLLVALHTWSGGYEQGLSYLPHAQQRKWILIAPNFRGANSKPTACASELAVQDVMDAVAYAEQHAQVDESRIYIVGGSGGGHMALMMSAHAPRKWAATSAWVPISDLAAWYAENKAMTPKGRYAQMLEAVCGGPPGPTTDIEYHARSPLFLLPGAKGLPMDINTGIHDGHKGSVPVSQSLRAFNVLAIANGLPDKQISETDIAYMVREQKIPATLSGECVNDPERVKPVLFRRVAGPVRITVFEGAHDGDTSAALNWLARQRCGSPADFHIESSSTTDKKAPQTVAP